jgi:hypothetical protein
MQKLRSLHLYLGCIFAPMLLLFAITGIWQTIGFRGPILGWLSALHTGARFKNGHEPTSGAFKLLVILMAFSFVVTTLLGVVMALKYGKNRAVAIFCLALGIIVPVGLVVIRMAA